MRRRLVPRAFIQDGETAELLDSQFERDTRAQRGLLEQERERLAAQRCAIVLGRALDVRRNIEELVKFVGGGVQIAGEIGVGQTLDPRQHGSHEFLFNTLNI